MPNGFLSIFGISIFCGEFVSEFVYGLLHGEDHTVEFVFVVHFLFALFILFGILFRLFDGLVDIRFG